ncbi:MAG: hypothetical protein GC154_16070 [bacterium]|nr:hypothetical protein [bacterium]
MPSAESIRPNRKRWLAAALAAAFIAGALILRLGLLSSSHLGEAANLSKRGDYLAALDAYTDSIRNYFPGNPWSRRAAGEAFQMIRSASREAQARRRDLEQLRGSILALRSFYQPYSSILNEIQTELGENNSP